MITFIAVTIALMIGRKWPGRNEQLSKIKKTFSPVNTCTSVATTAQVFSPVCLLLVVSIIIGN